jgi:zinc/manganese transport system substrate-binding protein
LADFIIANTQIEADQVNACASAYIEVLNELDAEVEAILAVVPDEMRRLVTTHEALGYFADRYGFEILGTALPGTSTLAATNPADLEDLAQAIAAAGVPAVFAEAEVSDADLQAVADRLGGVRVLPLRTEALGPEGSETSIYVDFITAAASTIADGLGS